ncbi:MAG: hypothetical protein WAT39_09935 [Planctomycetota bacterium]
MTAAPAELIAFLAPGLVHQFGNVLFTVQGHGATLEPATLARAQVAIANACERGGAGLRLFRLLLGEPGAWYAEAGATAAMVGELLRIPVREAGHTFELEVAPGELGRVEVGAFVAFAAGAVQALVAVVPQGVAGTVRLGVARDGGAVRAEVTFRRAAADLPFPLPVGETVAKVTALLARLGHATAVRARPDGLRAAWPAATGVVEA